MRRYVSIMLDAQMIAEWEYGFFVIGSVLRQQIGYHRLTEWPELARAEPVDSYGSWRLMFVWPEEYK